MMRFSEGGCGDSLEKENCYRMMMDEKENDKSNASARSRYTSQFAKKVRVEANKKKTACWSSMGVPSTEIDPPKNFLKKFSRQLPSHISIADFIQSRHQQNSGSSNNNNNSNTSNNNSRGTRGKLLHSLMSKVKSSSNCSIQNTYPSTSAVTLRNRNRARPPWNSYHNSKHRQDSSRSTHQMNGRRVPLLVRSRMNSRRANFRDAEFSLPLISNNRNANKNNKNKSCGDHSIPDFYSLVDEDDNNDDVDDYDYDDDDERVKLPPVTESTPNLQSKGSSSYNLNLSALNLPRLTRKENIDNNDNNNNNNNSNINSSLQQSCSSEKIPPVHNNRRKPPPEPNVSIKDLLAQTDMQTLLARNQKEEEEAIAKKLQQQQKSPVPVDRRNIRESVPHLLSSSPVLCESKHTNINGNNNNEHLPRLCSPTSKKSSEQRDKKERWEEEEEIIARLLAIHAKSLNKSKSTKFPPINQNQSQTRTNWNPATGDSPRNLDTDRSDQCQSQSQCRDPHPNLLPADPKLAQSTCDAFILRKLLELQNRGENIDIDIGKMLNSFRGKNGGGDENLNDLEEEMYNNNANKENVSGRIPISDCYNGEVGYIERGQKDFILENAIKCARMPAKIPQKKIVDDFHGNGKPIDLLRMVYKQDYGQVPEYIKRRKEELREEKEEMETSIEKEAQKKCRILTDAERKQIIQGLMQNWEELYVEFQKLPLFSSSHRVVKRKGEIEAKLRDLESDLRLIQRHGRLFVSNVGTAQFLWQ